MDAKRRIYIEPHDRTRRLAQLGLEETDLLQAVQVGQLQRMSCTPHHPIPYAGLSAWAETIKTLRDLYIPKGWHKQDPRGLPIVLSPDWDMAIAVATGDEATGREDCEPCTKSPKGPQTETAISNNQLCLFAETEFAQEIKDREQQGLITWLLLIHSDSHNREVRCELSLPVGMNEEGRVDGWDERIILGSIPFDADELEIPNDETPQSPNIIVNVKRRGA